MGCKTDIFGCRLPLGKEAQVSSKYVMFDNGIFVIFPATIGHRDIAAAHLDKTPTGAGFVALHPKEARLVCYGYSEGLNIGPGEDDEMIINAFMIRHD